jgi:hypothetical protein
MSRAAKTLFVWGFYLTALSVTLLFVPNLLLGLFGLPSTNEVWIRLVGMFLAFLAYYSFSSARTENTQFMTWSWHVRASVFVFFGAFVAFGLVSPMLLLFSVVDFAAAMWTRWALARDARG